MDAPSTRGWPLFEATASRRIEHMALAATAPHVLMARAGLGLARCVLDGGLQLDARPAA